MTAISTAKNLDSLDCVRLQLDHNASRASNHNALRHFDFLLTRSAGVLPRTKAASYSWLYSFGELYSWEAYQNIGCKSAATNIRRYGVAEKTKQTTRKRILLLARTGAGTYSRSFLFFFLSMELIWMFFMHFKRREEAVILDLCRKRLFYIQKLPLVLVPSAVHPVDVFTKYIQRTHFFFGSICSQLPSHTTAAIYRSCEVLPFVLLAPAVPWTDRTLTAVSVTISKYISRSCLCLARLPA